MAYAPQPITIARYEPKTIRVSMSPITNATGWTFSLNIRSAGSMLTGFPITAFTLENASSGIFTFALTSSMTGTFAAGAIYDYDIWRTNSGTEAQLAFGQLQVASQQWQSGG